MTTWRDPALDARIAKLDETSQDIRALERYLQDAGAAAVFVVVDLGQDERLVWSALGRVTWATAKVSRPLIEAPADVRLRARPFLPALVREIAAAIERIDNIATK